MAARRAWVVMVDDHRKFYQIDHDHIGGMFTPIEQNNELLSVYFREAHAYDAARYLASKYPGKDVHVFKQTIGFSTQPQNPITKEWTEDGQFVPVK